VATAHDGAFGADLVLTHKPAVVLLDYEMPVMNGLDCVKEIRKQDKIVKLIMVSGSNQIDSPQALLQYGLDEVILKPVDESKLIKAIKRLGI
jgi:two-component system response regulator YesN